MPAEGHFQPAGDFIGSLNQLLRPRLEKLGDSEAQNVKQDISVPVVYTDYGVIRSAPGEPPRTETGDLLEHVISRIVSQDNGVVMLEVV